MHDAVQNRDDLVMRFGKEEGAYQDPLVRLGVPAQPVDATPSNALIRQCFLGRSDLFGCTRSKPSQGSVPADLPGERFYLLFSMQGGFDLSVASTH